MTPSGILSREGVLHGLRTIAVRGARRVIRSANASAMGWHGSRLPVGSTVIGARRISVGTGFDAAQPVWLEAIESYAGERFEPAIVIGERLSTSGRLHVTAIARVEIGDDCLFGTNVYIGDHTHGALGGPDASRPSQPPRERRLASRGAVHIGDRVWLGDNVVVTDGVSIGDGCVVGANSVVTRDLPAATVSVGAPARVVRTFDPAARVWTESARRDAHA